MASDSPLHIEQSLKNLGFSKNETKVLIYLFQVQKTTAQDVSRNTAVSFSSVQFSLANLQRRGLVNVDPSEGGDDQYQVCSKAEFAGWIEEQRDKHDALYSQAETDLGHFFSFVDENSWQPTVQYYEGVEGIREIYRDMLNEGEDIYCWTDLMQVMDLLGKDFMNNFIEKRTEKGISMIVVRPDDVDAKLSSQGMGADQLRQVKLLQDLKLDGEVRIYGSKLAFITFHDEKPVGFVFGGGTTAKLFLNLFNAFWKLL